MTRRRTLAVATLLLGALAAAPALADEVVVPAGDGGVVVSRDLGDRYVCVGTVQQGKYCVVVWFPGQ